MPDYTPQPLDPVFSQQFTAPSPAPKRGGGMFGNAGKFLQNFIINYAAGSGNPMAQGYIQNKAQERELQRRAEAEAALFQQRRTDGIQDWIEKETWVRAHPSPVNNDTVADYQFIAERLGPDAAQNYLRTKTNPVVMTPYGPMPYSAVTAARPEVGAVIDDPRQQGGQTPPASGGFPGY
jgi:hypothetical protein